MSRADTGLDILKKRSPLSASPLGESFYGAHKAGQKGREKQIPFHTKKY